MKGIVCLALALPGLLWLAACASKPLVAFSTDTPPLILTPTALAGSEDKRARFREIYCAVLERDTNQFPDYRRCDDALTRVGTEPAATGRAVDVDASKRHLIAVVVPGIGYDCIAPWLASAGTVAAHLRKQGYDLMSIKVDALSSTARNARQIRDAIMAMPAEEGGPRLVLMGYSKGTPDILQALVTYPEILSRVAAVVSAAGAVGGSALANDAEQYQANLFRYFPGATCDAGDGGGVAELRTDVRKAWLAQHRLPAGPNYYSLVTFPHPQRISSILEGSYDKLSRIDARNDGQVIFYDQIIPGSALMGYVNADHWALAVPIARKHSTISSLFVTQNAYPREALTEAILRFVEDDLGGSAQ
ncbi:MAG TPA: hypothetical protein VN496_09650 [Burkholderiales bacterium]|nr:hypothetical protein [Burkholderiales bacterium]